jgi:hypothetical protein
MSKTVPVDGDDDGDAEWTSHLKSGGKAPKEGGTDISTGETINLDQPRFRQLMIET